MADELYPRCAARAGRISGDGRREACAKREGHAGPHLFPRGGYVEPVRGPGLGVGLILSAAAMFVLLVLTGLALALVWPR